MPFQDNPSTAGYKGDLNGFPMVLVPKIVDFFESLPDLPKSDLPKE